MEEIVGNILNFEGEILDPNRPNEKLGPEITTAQIDEIFGRKPRKRPDWIDEILAELSPDEVAQLRREIDDRFDLALICYCQMRH